MSAGAAFRFYFLQLRQFHPALLAALLFASALLVLSVGSYLVNIDKLKTEQGALERSLRPSSPPAELTMAVKPLALPPFDSTILVSAIEHEATAAKVSTDTFTLVLEDGTAQPYRRYRASFVMLGRYPQIRTTIAGVLKKVPYSSLDSIKCMRDDIGEVDVNCTVNMSAFYKRPHSP